MAKMARRSYIIQFDVMHLDGNLAGMLIPGRTVTYSNRSDAERALQFYRGVEKAGDFIRATVTGHRYQVSNVGMFFAPQVRSAV